MWRETSLLYCFFRIHLLFLRLLFSTGTYSPSVQYRCVLTFWRRPEWASHEPVGNVNSCRRKSTADIKCISITVDISFGLASMPGSETRLSNAALSINLKLVVVGEITHEISHGLWDISWVISPITTRLTGSARDKILWVSRWKLRKNIYLTNMFVL